jgi:pathogenesis-related protein 1
MRRSGLRLAAICAVANSIAGLAATPDPVFIDGFGAEPAALAGITTGHNVVRSGVGVAPLFWDERLAATAQAWADQCVDLASPFGLLDDNPNRSVGYPWDVGENVYSSGGAATPQGALGIWAEEQANYDYDTNTCQSGTCGHYTQMVWSTSVLLGCGISSCPALAFPGSIVCNYGPGGNSGGRPY